MQSKTDEVELWKLVEARVTAKLRSAEAIHVIPVSVFNFPLLSSICVVLSCMCHVINYIRLWVILYYNL